jgi:GTPase SAR1 family protein
MLEQLKTVPLNQGQQAAADGFFQFLFGTDKELIMSGPGGVGKTFLMGYLIDQVMPQYLSTCKMMGIPAEYTDVVMTATTNKAAEVLTEATGRPCSTIHSFLNLTMREDYKTGRVHLTKGAKWKVHQSTILFIDECSMIDSDLRRYILEGTARCKIVYVGDHCQLAPVTETLSPVYRDKLPFFELTEQMRTNIGALQATNLQLRQTVETGEFKPIRIVPGVIDLLSDEEMEYEIGRQFAEQTHDKRILAYRNDRVIEYNEHIRGVRQLPEQFVKGEFLVNNNAITLSNGMIRVEEEVEIERQDDPEMMPVDHNVELEYRLTTLKNRRGEMYYNAMVPVDREHHLKLIKYYAKQKNWDRYFFLKNNFPDLRQRDAATTHKAQGSTYDTVFIDVGDLSTCHNPNVVARLLYVAFTRARQRVMLYGTLAEKYGGLIN